MVKMRFLAVHLLLLGSGHCNVIPRDGTDISCPSVVDSTQNLTYNGLYESGVEAFLGIKYGQDTGGQNRFKPPQPYTYPARSIINAQMNGPACPQPLGDKPFPVYLSNVTEISEDCLLLNIKRPNGTTKDSKYPVMAFIHGGGYSTNKFGAECAVNKLQIRSLAHQKMRW